MSVFFPNTVAPQHTNKSQRWYHQWLNVTLSWIIDYYVFLVTYSTLFEKCDDCILCIQVNKMLTHCAANPVSIIGLSIILMYVLWITVQAIELVDKAACTLVVFGNNR